MEQQVKGEPAGRQPNVPPPNTGDISITATGIAFFCLECASGAQSWNQDGEATGGHSEAAASGLPLLSGAGGYALEIRNLTAAEVCHHSSYQGEPRCVEDQWPARHCTWPFKFKEIKMHQKSLMVVAFTQLSDGQRESRHKSLKVFRKDQILRAQARCLLP